MLRKEKYILCRIYLYFRGTWGESELIVGIWGAKTNYFQGAGDFSGIWGDQRIIFREQGSTDPMGGGYSDIFIHMYARIIFLGSKF